MTVFADIYENDAWGCGSGAGSLASVTIGYRHFIESFIHLNNIRTVVDCGCGDWQFSRFIDWGGARYLGYDVVPSVIAANTAAFATPPRVEFRHYGGDFAELPAADLLICKDVLQHLSHRRIGDFIEATRGRFRHSLITNCVYPAQDCNREIDDGSFRPLDLRGAPFHLPFAAVHSFSGTLPGSGQYWNKIVLLGSNPARLAP